MSSSEFQGGDCTKSSDPKSIDAKTLKNMRRIGTWMHKTEKNGELLQTSLMVVNQWLQPKDK